MRILCVCNGGNVRSVTLARLLRKRGFETLNCGVDSTFSSETLIFLFNWADKIFFQEDAWRKLNKRLSDEKYKGNADLNYCVEFVTKSKADFRYNVGPDDWKVPQRPELLTIMRQLVVLFPPDQSYTGVSVGLEDEAISHHSS